MSEQCRYIDFFARIMAYLHDSLRSDKFVFTYGEEDLPITSMFVRCVDRSDNSGDHLEKNMFSILTDPEKMNRLLNSKEKAAEGVMFCGTFMVSTETTAETIVEELTSFCRNTLYQWNGFHLWIRCSTTDTTAIQVISPVEYSTWLVVPPTEWAPFLSSSFTTAAAAAAAKNYEREGLYSFFFKKMNEFAEKQFESKPSQDTIKQKAHAVTTLSTKGTNYQFWVSSSIMLAYDQTCNANEEEELHVRTDPIQQKEDGTFYLWLHYDENVL